MVLGVVIGFLLNRVCIIADLGMVSAKTIATLEAHKIEYILGRTRGRSKSH